MKTFFTVKLTLVPFAAFLILLGYTTPEAAILWGLALAAAGCAWSAARGGLRKIQLGMLGIFAALAIAHFVAPGFGDPNAGALFFAGLGLFCLATVTARAPWTSDFSRASFAGADENPLFVAVNMAISGLWGALFLALAMAHAVQASSWVTTGIVVGGACVSIFGPKALVSFGVKRLIAARETYKWPAPDFAASRSNAEVDVAIVGAGIGGLTAAALLADAGLKVALFDQHVVPGGFCHTFLRKARHEGQPYVYRFDAGPHDFSGLWNGGSVDSLLKRLGVADRIEWRRVDHMFKLAGVSIDVPRDWREYVAELGRHFPESAAGFAALFDDLHAIYTGMMSTGAPNGGIPGMPSTVEGMLAIPREHPLTMKWMPRPFDELVAKHLRDPKAIEIVNALTGYISDGSEVLTCAQMAPVFGYYFDGGVYPVGGSGRLADVLAEAIEERGGTVRLKTAVAEILVENGSASGVLLRDGTRIAARAVVSNADVKRTFTELVDAQHLPEDFRARVAAAAPANSCFMVHLGVDFVPDVKPAMHVHGDVSVGVEVLSRVDPSAAPAGHSTVGIIALLPYEEAQTWFAAEAGDDWKILRNSAEYEERKTAFGDRMIEAAEEVIPELRQHIVYRADASPVTYARYDWASAGSIYGVSPQGRMSGVKSPVSGLVVAGSATHGAGVEAVLISGAYAAEALVPGLLARGSASPMPAMAETAARSAQAVAA